MLIYVIEFSFLFIYFVVYTRRGYIGDSTAFISACAACVTWVSGDESF